MERELQPNIEAHFVRHSQAFYQKVMDILSSNDPQRGINFEDQTFQDLTEKGIDLAKKEAEKFFETLNPEEDVVFFLSSSETRALNTADIYREEAHRRKIEVVRSQKAEDESMEGIGGGEIRTLKSLVPNTDNALIASVFASQEVVEEINWEAVPFELKEKWNEARNIVKKDYQSSWGLNFLAHSEEVQKIFPELKNSQDLYKRDFQRLMRLLRFGARKTRELKPQKKIRIMVFGHEDYMVFAIKKHFQEMGIKNCEMVTFSVEGDQIKSRFRDKERKY